VLGSGGSSAAVRFALEGLGLKVTVISRNPKPGQVSYDDLTPEIILSADLIVNTTPLGMFPDIDTKPGINYDLLNSRHTLFDLVYNPELTSFLKTGQERGCKIITGLKMLYSQAERSWEIWNDPAL
jgi:shikimate dehydrogenase